MTKFNPENKESLSYLECLGPAMSITAPPAVVQPGHKMLAQYTIPLGSNQATLVFTGEQLTPDDFDALVDFVQFSKRQFERALKTKPKDTDSATNSANSSASESQ